MEQQKVTSCHSKHQHRSLPSFRVWSRAIVGMVSLRRATQVLPMILRSTVLKRMTSRTQSMGLLFLGWGLFCSEYRIEIHGTSPLVNMCWWEGGIRDGVWSRTSLGTWNMAATTFLTNLRVTLWDVCMMFWSFELALTNRAKTDRESCGWRRDFKSKS